jgi:hypothetical protein
MPGGVSWRHSQAEMWNQNGRDSQRLLSCGCVKFLDDLNFSKVGLLSLLAACFYPCVVSDKVDFIMGIAGQNVFI